MTAIKNTPIKRVARSQDNPNFIKMYHGNLEIMVPRKIFKNGTSEFNDEEMEKFLSIIKSRYPWLSVYALDEIKKGAVEAMKDHIERSKTTPQRARDYMNSGKNQEALRILEEYLVDNEDDADAWYVTAEVLFKLKRQEEGFKAMNYAKSLPKKGH
ncbi:tetratricopeptide repeat protein [Candidatus Methanomassiliicoccus intestinalis]|nr:tetratricopeptide repeat protein [Candidatus Methanomassiliicoccus intestinalis]